MARRPKRDLEHERALQAIATDLQAMLRDRLTDLKRVVDHFCQIRDLEAEINELHATIASKSQMLERLKNEYPIDNL